MKEYQTPFEAEVGLCPSLEDMQELVVVRQQRPQISDEWLQDPVSYSSCLYNSWRFDVAVMRWS